MSFHGNEDSVKEKKRNKTAIIALIVISALLVCGGVGAGIYFLVDYVKSNTITAPANLRIEEFDESKSLYVRVRWDIVEAAETYTVEYVYGLYPDKVNTVIVNKSGTDIERKRGDLTVRVTATNKSGDALSSEWKVFGIPGFVLAQPKVTVKQLEKGSINYEWNKVTYSGALDTKYVPYYEWKETFYYAPIDEGDDYEKEETERTVKTTPLNSFSISAAIVNKLKSDGIGKIVIQVRPLNYGLALDGETRIGIVDLYDLYEIPEWSEAELIF